MQVFLCFLPETNLEASQSFRVLSWVERHNILRRGFSGVSVGSSMTSKARCFVSAFCCAMRTSSTTGTCIDENSRLTHLSCIHFQSSPQPCLAIPPWAHLSTSCWESNRSNLHMGRPAKGTSLTTGETSDPYPIHPPTQTAGPDQHPPSEQLLSEQLGLKVPRASSSTPAFQAPKKTQLRTTKGQRKLMEICVAVRHDGLG